MWERKTCTQIFYAHNFIHRHYFFRLRLFWSHKQRIAIIWSTYRNNIAYVSHIGNLRQFFFDKHWTTNCWPPFRTKKMLRNWKKCLHWISHNAQNTWSNGMCRTFFIELKKFQFWPFRKILGQFENADRRRTEYNVSIIKQALRIHNRENKFLRFASGSFFFPKFKCLMLNHVEIWISKPEKNYSMNLICKILIPRKNNFWLHKKPDFFIAVWART